MDLLLVDARQNFREKIGLLLVVALEADPIARADDSLEKRLCTLRRRQLAVGVTGTCIQAGFPLAPLLLPVFGVAGVPRLTVCAPFGRSARALSCGPVIPPIALSPRRYSFLPQFNHDLGQLYSTRSSSY
jgi:hypothetical protein